MRGTGHFAPSLVSRYLVFLLLSCLLEVLTLYRHSASKAGQAGRPHTAADDKKKLVQAGTPTLQCQHYLAPAVLCEIF